MFSFLDTALYGEGSPGTGGTGGAGGAGGAASRTPANARGGETQVQGRGALHVQTREGAQAPEQNPPQPVVLQPSPVTEQQFLMAIETLQTRLASAEKRGLLMERCEVRIGKDSCVFAI